MKKAIEVYEKDYHEILPNTNKCYKKKCGCDLAWCGHNLAREFH